MATATTMVTNKKINIFYYDIHTTEKKMINSVTIRRREFRSFLNLNVASLLGIFMNSCRGFGRKIIDDQSDIRIFGTSLK